MTETDHHLAEFELTKTKPDAVEKIILRLDLIFLLLALGLVVYKYLYLKINFNHITVYQLLFTIGSPVVLWLMFSKGWKTGWLLRLIFYTLFAIVMLKNLTTQELAKENLVLMLIILLISLGIIGGSFYNKIIIRYKVGWKLISLYVLITVSLGYMFFIIVP